MRANAFQDKIKNSITGSLAKELFNKKVKINKLAYFDISSNYKSILAYNTKALDKTGKPVKSNVFKVTFSVNVQLPSYFSVGQRVAYGLGVFMKDISKKHHHEKTKINPKATKKE